MAADDPWPFVVQSGVRTVLGIEMEAYAVASAAWRAGVEWVVIKGVSDLALPGKDSRQDAPYQRFAARAAAEVMWDFLAQRWSADRDRLSRGHTEEGAKRDKHGVAVGHAETLPDSNLPIMVDATIGRADLLSTCLETLRNDSTRILTLVGTPGVGKTRLAVQLAAAVADGFERTYFVDLTTVSDPELVIASITNVMRIKAGDPLLEALRELFRGHPTLVVLDNFEQVIAAAPRVADLVAAIPELTLVVTSRTPLHIGVERTHEVGPLTLTEAVELFAHISGQAVPEAVERSRIEELCELVDRLALAVELVAARAESPRDQLRMLGRGTEPHHLLNLKNQRRDVSDNQQSMRATVEWSYRLLAPAEQDIFTRLCVFDGGWTIDTAQAVVGGDPGIVVDAIDVLVDNRLAVRESEGGAGTRFRMFAVIQGFGSQLLLDRPEQRTEVVYRHAHHFLDVAVASQSLGDDEQMAIVASDYANFRAALGHLVEAGASAAALRLAKVIGQYWWSQNYAEGYRQLELVLNLSRAKHATGDEVALRSSVLVLFAHLAIRQAKLETAEEAVGEALADLTSPGDGMARARALSVRALVHMDAGRFGAAKSDLTEALEVFETFDDADGRRGLADCHDGLGLIAQEAGEPEYETAASELRRSRELYERGDSECSLAWVDNDTAQLRLLEGDRPAAQALAQRAFEVGQVEADRGVMCWALNYLGHGALDDAETTAREAFNESLTLAIILGNTRPQLRALEGISALAASVGRWSDALVIEAAVQQIRERVGLPRSPVEYRLVKSWLTRSSTKIDQSAVNESTRRGRRLSRDDLIDFARAI